MKRLTAIRELGLEIEWAQAGDIVSSPSRDGLGQPMMVLKGCAEGSHVFYCVYCNAGLANVGQLEMHVENGGTHLITIWCDRRHLYEAVDPVPDLRVGAAA